MKSKFFNSIKHKLMLYVIMLCALLIALVWFLNIQLLEPSYIAMLKRELLRVCDTTATLIEKHGNIASITDGVVIGNADFETELNTAVSGILAGKCVDIADANTFNHVMGYEGLNERCLIHPVKAMFFTGNRSEAWNSSISLEMRSQIFDNGNLSITLASERGNNSQLVVGKLAGNYIVTVSQDLERIGQATNVLTKQMIMISTVLLVVSALSAYIFSRWFTNPLTKLSGAAREMAKGNYTVRVSPKSSDEIGVLCEDFNTMAGEVARSAQLQRDLIANISHDLRTPLTLIKGYAETVRDLTGEEKDKRTAQLNVIVDETDRLSGLVNSVMELSKYSSGTEKLNCVNFDLAQLCDEVAYKYLDLCEKNGYNLTVDANDECLVNADPDMMSRVIHNWLANAIHHVGSDGFIAVRCKMENDHVRLEVEDHGEGIISEDLPYIFDKYYRTRASAGKVGTGLGLSISKAILINHGYQFGVKSVHGDGSTFWFTTK